jgi:hypothetical protein
MNNNNNNFYKTTSTEKVVVTKTSSNTTRSTSTSSTTNSYVPNPYIITPKKHHVSFADPVEETDGYEQYPPIGKKRRVSLEDEDHNTVSTIMPRVEMKNERSTDPSEIGWTVDEGDAWHTLVRVPNYTNFVTDIDYVTKKHAIINGKMDEWRKAQSDLLDKVQGDPVMGPIYKEECYVNQRQWVEYKVPEIMLGIGEFTKFSIDILHREALLQFLPGVEDKEQADFVYRIATSDHFELDVEPMTDRSDFTIDTIFNERIRRTYGKTYVHH